MTEHIKTTDDETPGSREQGPTEIVAASLPRTWDCRPKYFVALLSTKGNLDICRSCETAGFPDAENGRWAFLDIEVGDYLSFYHSYRICDLYRVEEKYIPEYHYSSTTLGKKAMDPVPVEGSTSWKGISTKNGILYFPYRLKLRRVEETDINSLVIFKPEFAQFGANLLPRGSIRKTHIQLPVGTMDHVFSGRPTPRNMMTNHGLEWFIRTETRARGNQGKAVRTYSDIVSKETFLQTMARKILESLWSSIGPAMGLAGDAEFLSEQAVLGGQADIVVMTQTSALVIETKRATIAVHRKSGLFWLTTKGREARNQVLEYEPLWVTQNLERGILGINPSNEGEFKMSGIQDHVWMMEIDGATQIH